MKILYFVLSFTISSVLQAQNYIAFDANKTGEEKRAALEAAEKSKSMTVK